MRLLATVAVAILLRPAFGTPIAQTAAADTSVVLHVTVTDQDQRIVASLAKDDFEIYDNGEVQTLTSFDVNPQPLNLVVMLDTSGSMAAARGVIELASRATHRRQFFRAILTAARSDRTSCQNPVKRFFREARERRSSRE